MNGTLTQPDLTDFQPAAAVPGTEEVLIRYTRGSGRFSDDKRFITLDMKMFQPDGTPDGIHQGVWERLFETPQELLAVPPEPQRPFDVPEPPIPVLDPLAATKGVWRFGDGSEVEAVGPAMSTLSPLPDGSFLFMVATMQWITGGTGRFAGAQGLKSSLGSTHIPPGVDLFGPEPVRFTATTIDTFRLVPGSSVGPIPSA
jgi:hypothetical protein